MRYSLRKCRHILVKLFYRVKKAGLPTEQTRQWRQQLQALAAAVEREDRTEADRLARELEAQGRVTLAKPTWRRWLGTAGALLVALLLATLIRQVWFELYSIPTGSMRPTLEEENRLVVSKISYGLNVPLKADHLYFNPDLVRRTDLIVFSTENLPIPDSETLYFYLFPTYKQYVKRLVGKPGDTVYFYGGQVYGIDRDGHELLGLRNSPDVASVEYVPLISWDGRAVATGTSLSTPQGKLARGCQLTQMGQPIARLNWGGREVQGEILTPEGWRRDEAAAGGKPHDQIRTYSDFWGLRNYAMGRLLTAEQVRQYTTLSLDQLGGGLLYLQLFHTPSASYPAPELGVDRMGLIRPHLTPRVTAVALGQPQLDRMMEQMTTTRFVVRNERALPYSYEKLNWDTYRNVSVPLAGVPDGTYEFIRGVGYRIWWSGVRTRLAANHPLYDSSAERIQTLYNLGIEWLTLFAPRQGDGPFLPSRFVYFRNGALWTLGGPIFGRDDPVLEGFLQRELERQESSSTDRPYVAFRDWGPPLLANGSLDVAKIRAFGFRVPDKGYLALGDNHAVSLDSRDFGPVPEANLSGSPLFVFWPPGVQWGTLPQPSLYWWTVPHLIVWGLVFLISLIWWILRRRREQTCIRELKNPV
jgi:signal peptidase I